MRGMNRKFAQRSRWSLVPRWLALALLVPALSSCVTYYYPATEQADGVYYAADDPVYGSAAVEYVDVSYYPWWSVDYFYLGYSYYGGGVSIGYRHGYPFWPRHSLAWYTYPYGYAAWYHDPWRVGWWYGPPRYDPWRGHHGHHAYWHVHNRHHRDRYAHRSGGWDRRRHDGDRFGYYDGDRYVRGDTRSRRRAGEPAENGDGHYRARGHGRDEIGSWDGDGSTRRRVSVAGSEPNDRGMVVVNRDGGKWSRSKLEPVGARRPVQESPSLQKPPGSDTRPTYRVVRKDGVTVRKSASTKIGRSRTTPDTGALPPARASSDVRPSTSVPASRAPSSLGGGGRRADVIDVNRPSRVSQDRPPASHAKPPSSRSASPPRSRPARPSRDADTGSVRSKSSRGRSGKRDR